MRKSDRLVVILVLLTATILPASGWDFAVDLAKSGDYPQAAVEFRRLAMSYEAADERGTFAWLAGYAYWQASRYWQAERMLNITEEAAPALETEIYLLRAGNNRSWHRPDEAAFYLESLMDESRQEPVRRLATLQLAAVKVETGKLAAARDLLAASPFDGDMAAVTAIDEYSQGCDKSVVAGGLLGLVPGLGYAYSGEYANALRSLILNALCIWGVVDFADREQWGGVAVVGFAGVTFYSGSIYGGADAAARYNRRRLEACTRAIEKNARFEPDYGALPLLDLKFRF